MNERNLKDLINCDSTDKEKMMEAAKEKLRWYTFEASEEEFDVEAVDALVKFLKDVEPELGVILEDEKNKSVHVQKRRVIEWNRGKIAVAVVIGVLTLTLASIIVGNSLGTSLAWEDGGFFRWLRKDEKGQTMITSPENLGMEDGNIIHFYDKVSEVPRQYQDYLIKQDEMFEIEKYEIERINVYDSPALTKVSTRFVSGEMYLEFGVVIYENEKNILRDSYDEYVWQYSNIVDNHKYDIYAKQIPDQKMEFLICFLVNNKEYFLASQMELEKISDFAKKYIHYITNTQ